MSSCPSFPWWQNIIWICKLKSALSSPVASDLGLHHSSRNKTRTMLLPGIRPVRTFYRTISMLMHLCLFRNQRERDSPAGSWCASNNQGCPRERKSCQPPLPPSSRSSSYSPSPSLPSLCVHTLSLTLTALSESFLRHHGPHVLLLLLLLFLSDKGVVVVLLGLGICQFR